MTNKEIIEQLKSLKSHCEDFREDEESVWAKDVEALDSAIEALGKQMQNCENCRHADCVPNNHMIYCLEHSCVMSGDNCCRDWSDEDEA
ncbi:MAG: hypothetical protein Q4C46_05570 [Bacillota bacterium]|nr:hypothetical protein [Bacillota bacterium]